MTSYNLTVAALTLRPLAAIADAFDKNELDDEARKFWGPDGEHENTTPHDQIEIYQGRGGRELLTLEDAMIAREALRSEEGIPKALERLAAIADAYDANELDDEARKTWGARGEHTNMVLLADIEIYQGRGGRRLLTLQDAMDARSALKTVRSAH